MLKSVRLHSRYFNELDEESGFEKTIKAINALFAESGRGLVDRSVISVKFADWWMSAEEIWDWERPGGGKDQDSAKWMEQRETLK